MRHDVCDGCGHSEDSETARVLILRRDEPWSFPLYERDRPEADPLLGRRGLMFHSYDCLRVWLIAQVEVKR